MARKSNAKNIILTNLPAAIALILMATALKLTLQFNFLISLLVLIVMYFILGVLIELILDKVQNQKKKEDLYRRYAEGGSGSLPTGTESFDDDETLYFTQKTLDIGTALQEVMADREDEEDETEPQEINFENFDQAGGAVSVEPIHKTSEEESHAIEVQAESAVQEPETATEEADDPKTAEDFLNISLHDLKEEAKAEEEVPVDSVSVEDISDLAVEPDDGIEILLNPVIEEVQDETEESVEEVFESSELSDSSTGDIASIEIPLDEEVQEALTEALKDVGVMAAEEESQEEDASPEEVEARRSLFDEGDEFDAGADKLGRKSSLLFGSVPDTEDDIPYIPATNMMENTVPAQKGKVQVDSKKIEDLYSIKKSKPGEKFFGKWRK